MGYKTELELLDALTSAYYTERDVEKVLALLTEQTEWIGTETRDDAYGKDAVKSLLEREMNEYPDPYTIEMQTPVVTKLSDDISRISFHASQIAVPGLVCGLKLRMSGTCVRQKNGDCLFDSIHVSVPNSEIEKDSLQKELDEKRKKERTLLSDLPGGIAIYRVKKNGKVATDYVSESLAKMCGYTATEFYEYLKENSLVNLVPEDVPKVQKVVEESLMNGTSISVDYHIYKKDRTPFMIHLDANVLQQEKINKDEIAVFCAVHTIVSDNDKNRIQDQQHYRNLMNILGIAYWEWSRENGYYSSEKYYDYAVSEAADDDIWNIEKCHQYIHPDDIALYDEFVKQEGNETVRESAVVRSLMRDGSYQWTEMFSFAELDEENQVSRIISVMRKVDKEWIEQKEQLQKALRDAELANQAKTDFLSRVSHDMRTPLNGILGMTAILQDYVIETEVRRDLTSIEQSGKYLLNLINDTLDVSKIESGKMELNPIVCDGRTAFNTAISLVTPNIKEKNITLNIHADNLKFTVLYIDIGRVQQIVMNIIGNAAKFTPEGGQIDFRMINIGVKDGVITDQIVIEDNGVGMSEEFLPHLFEPFSQERNTSTSSSKGTGLGMTITKQIIELMGGTIEVESKLGKGTKFTLILPMQIATDEQIAEWKKKRCVGSSLHNLEKKRVLLCEDHPLNAMIATRILESKGLQVTHAENGKEGLEKFESAPNAYFDAILMDIRMPVMNGIDATKAIRVLDREDAKSIPIIAMTANALSSDMEETEKAGMNAHLSKPIEPALLYATLQTLILKQNTYQRAKVLIVDDIEVNRLVIAEAINAEFDVIEAEDGEQALEILKTVHGIDVVITDVQMPVMDGFELIKRIRDVKDYRHIVIIANTQYGEPEQHETLLKLGANDFVYKPTTPKSVEMRIHNALNKI